MSLLQRAMRDHLVGTVSDDLRHVDDVVQALLAGKLSARELIVRSSEPTIDDQVFHRWAGVRSTYFMRMLVPGKRGPLKIGMARDPDARVEAHTVSSPYPLQLVAAVPASFLSEYVAHAMLSRFRLRGEWFAPRATVERLARECAEFVAIQEQLYPWTRPTTAFEADERRRQLTEAGR